MKLIGIGDNVVDRYINKRIMFPGGNAVNFAVYARQCGEESAYLGLIADEPEGRLVYDSLQELGVDVSHSEPVRGITTERCDVTLIDGDRTFVGCEYGEGEWRRECADLPVSRRRQPQYPSDSAARIRPTDACSWRN